MYKLKVINTFPILYSFLLNQNGIETNSIILLMNLIIESIVKNFTLKGSFVAIRNNR